MQKKMTAKVWLLALWQGVQRARGALAKTGQNDDAWAVTSFPEQLGEHGFVDLTFRIMGRVCKQSGTVQPQEIEYARQLMQKMRLGPKATKAAMQAFNEGKQPGWSFTGHLQELHQRNKDRLWVRQLFVELQLRAAFAAGLAGDAELVLLRDICHLLRVSNLQFAIIKARVERAYHASNRPLPATTQALKQLGLTTHASEQEVRLAYKRLISRYHPDRYPQPELKAQMEHRAREVNQAYRYLRDRF